ncbi:MAG: PKD domain-containing protein, partial [Thermoanaerobaculia bacterium]
QGPWANYENYLGDLAQTQNKEVYIYAGPAGSIGTVKGEGKINFPKFTWKIALILPRGEGLADVHDYRDVQITAVVMPNMPGVRNADWATQYVVTPDSVQKLTGFQFFTSLDARTRRALLTETQPPLGSVDGPYTSAEGSAVNMSAAGSLDPNGSIVSYQWSFGDGGTATGSSVSHTYTNNGTYNVNMIVTDNDGLVDTVATTASVSNVAPVVQPFSGANLLPGETYSANGTFTDPGSDNWSGTINYGDGSGSQSLALSGKTFTLSHTYTAPGTFTATVGVFDGDATGSLGETVTVISAADGLTNLSNMVDSLITSGGLSSGNGNALSSKLDAAAKQLGANNNAAVNQLQAFINQVNALIGAGRLDPAQGAALKALATRLIATASL